MNAHARSVPMSGYRRATERLGAQIPVSTLLKEVPPVTRFRSLVDSWKASSLNLSSIEDMVLLPSYLEIIGIGPAAIPLLIDELEREPDHWFPALTAITGVSPVLPADQGDLDRMAHAWIKWAKANGYR